MAEHTHTLTSHVSAETVWAFVSDMDQWAPFLLGYQAHDQQSDRESLWTIKAELASLSRTVDFRVQITEWVEPVEVRFTLEGIGEPMQGEGWFRIDALEDSSVPTPVETRASAAPGGFVRWWATLLRRLLGRGSARTAESTAASTRPAAVRLTFSLSLTPGGAMAPMIEAMIKPVMVATAEDLAQRIVLHLEGR